MPISVRIFCPLSVCRDSARCPDSDVIISSVISFWYMPCWLLIKLATFSWLVNQQLNWMLQRERQASLDGDRQSVHMDGERLYPYTATMLSWSLIDSAPAYKAAKEYKNALSQVKWGLKWLIKALKYQPVSGPLVGPFLGRANHQSVNPCFWFAIN